MSVEFSLGGTSKLKVLKHIYVNSGLSHSFGIVLCWIIWMRLFFDSSAVTPGLLFMEITKCLEMLLLLEGDKK